MQVNTSMVLSSKFICTKLVLFTKTLVEQELIFSYLSYSRGNLNVIRDHAVVKSKTSQVISNSCQVKFKIHFIKHLTTERYGSPTVHNRGRGYSNSCTLCRGRTFPQLSINPSGQPWVIIHKYADNQSLPIWLLTLVQALLYEVGLNRHGNPLCWDS